MSIVTELAAATSSDALIHFESILQFETDCWDVHHSMTSGALDFALLDVRGPAQYAAGHVPGARYLPHGKIVGTKLAQYSTYTIFETRWAAAWLQYISMDRVIVSFQVRKSVSKISPHRCLPRCDAARHAPKRSRSIFTDCRLAIYAGDVGAVIAPQNIHPFYARYNRELPGHQRVPRTCGSIRDPASAVHAVGECFGDLAGPSVDGRNPRPGAAGMVDCPVDTYSKRV